MKAEIGPPASASVSSIGAERKDTKMGNNDVMSSPKSSPKKQDGSGPRSSTASSSAYTTSTNPTTFSTTPSWETSSSSRRSSVASTSSSSHAASSAHGHLAASPGLLSPSLASTLGIGPLAPRSDRTKRAGQRPKTSQASHHCPSLLQQGPNHLTREQQHQQGVQTPSWTRRPSLPTMPSMLNRVSMMSVASFESLPEGETLPSFQSSPLSHPPPFSASPTLSSSSFTAISDNRIEGSQPRVSFPSDLTGGASEATTSTEICDSPESSTAHHRKAIGRERALRRSSTEPTPIVPASRRGDLEKRRRVAMELLETEKVYVASLKLINENYYAPLMALSKGASVSSVSTLTSAAPVLSRKALGEIFSNFIDIHNLNAELLTRLDSRLSGRSREAPTSRPTSVVSPSAEAEETSSTKPWDPDGDCIGDILVPMVPFLKMYSLYVKNFSSALGRIEAERRSNDGFVRFLKDTEKATWGRASMDGGFGFGLGFQAHLLTIVQRIPRYKMLLGDLLKHTPTGHRDWTDLRKAYEVVEQVASYINDNIRQHEMIISMLSLQRSLVGLTEPLVAPGRSLLKHSTLLKACRKNIQPREFFLFNDCLVYASPLSGGIDAASAAWQVLSGGAGLYATNPTTTGHPSQWSGVPQSPQMSSPSSGSHQTQGTDHTNNGPRNRTRTTSGPSPFPDARRKSLPTEVLANGTSVGSHPQPIWASQHQQQLQYRGKFALQDVTVVGVEDTRESPDVWLRHSFEIRTPDKSFAVYAASSDDKFDWLDAIRGAREEWLSKRRTLQAEEDSIEAKRERRRSMYGMVSSAAAAAAAAAAASASGFGGVGGSYYGVAVTGRTPLGRSSAGALASPPSSSAIPEGDEQESNMQFPSTEQKIDRPTSFPPLASTPGQDQSLATHFQSSAASANGSRSGMDGMNATQSNTKTKLRVLDDYHAPVWVPDSRADRCIVCSEPFGLWRRKHHCRLCGQVVCWACSTKTFLIASYEIGEEDRPARACDSCYDSVFAPEEEEDEHEHGQAPESNPSLGIGMTVASMMDKEERRPSWTSTGTARVDSDASTSSPSTPLEASSPSDVQPALQDSTETAKVNVEDTTVQAMAEQDVHVKGESTVAKRSSSLSPPKGLFLNHHHRYSQPPTASPHHHHYQQHHLFPSTQLFTGNHSPQVQAATSGAGTFRLVTPRLTTPDGSMEIATSRRGMEDEGEEREGEKGCEMIRPGQDGASYFAGIHPGAQDVESSRHLMDDSRLVKEKVKEEEQSHSKSSSDLPVAAKLRPFRKKPLSAAARLSSVYGLSKGGGGSPLPKS